MRVSAKVDYALRACAELAAANEGPVKGDRLAQAQEIPLKFLENILLDLKHAGLVQSQRGADGGYWLSLPPEEISLAEVIRAVEGPIANVRGQRPELGVHVADGHEPDRWQRGGEDRARASVRRRVRLAGHPGADDGDPDAAFAVISHAFSLEDPPGSPGRSELRGALQWSAPTM